MNSPAAWQSKLRPSNEITCGSPKFPPVLIGGVGARVDGLFVGGDDDGLFVGDRVVVEGDVEVLMTASLVNWKVLSLEIHLELSWDIH